jgi:hypothetical protein
VPSGILPKRANTQSLSNEVRAVGSAMTGDQKDRLQASVSIVFFIILGIRG